MHLALSQRNLSDGSNPTFCAGRKIGLVDQALLWNLLQGDPECPSRVLRLLPTGQLDFFALIR